MRTRRPVAIVLLSVATAALSTMAYGHSLVDVRMSIEAPPFVVLRQPFTYRVIADDLANDNAFGVVVTSTLPSNVQFTKASGAGWLCSGSRTITCSAEQLTPGPNVIEIQVVAPAATGPLTVTTSVTSLGSFDPNAANDKATFAHTAYDPARCSQAIPQLIEPADQATIAGSTVHFRWSAAASSTARYRLFASLEEARPTLLVTTTSTEAAVPITGGRMEWWIEATFSDCPTVVSARRGALTRRSGRLVVTGLTGSPERAETADGPFDRASFRAPFGVAISPGGELFVTDSEDSVVRRVAAGEATVVVGSVGVTSAQDGQFAKFNHPRGIAITPLDGYIYVADTGNHSVRILYTGGPFIPAYTAAGIAGTPGFADGAPGTARFSSPRAIAGDERGTLYVADTGNHAVRKLTPVPGTTGAFDVTTLGGRGGVAGAVDGAAADARFNAPAGVAVGADNVVWVADTENHTIRKISGGVVSTFAGAAGEAGSSDGIGADARFDRPTALAFDAVGNLYVCDSGNHTVRRIAPSGLVITVAGLAGKRGTANGSGEAALFTDPTGIAVAADGTIYIADAGGHSIRLAQSATPTEERRRTTAH